MQIENIIAIAVSTVSLVSCCIGVIWKVQKMTEDIRNNFKIRVDEKASQKTVDLFHKKKAPPYLQQMAVTSLRYY